MGVLRLLAGWRRGSSPATSAARSLRRRGGSPTAQPFWLPRVASELGVLVMAMVAWIVSIGACGWGVTQGEASAEASCEEGVLRAESCEGSWQREGGTSPLMGLGLGLATWCLLTRVVPLGQLRSWPYGVLAVLSMFVLAALGTRHLRRPRTMPEEVASRYPFAVPTGSDPLSGGPYPCPWHWACKRAFGDCTSRVWIAWTRRFHYGR